MLLRQQFRVIVQQQNILTDTKRVSSITQEMSNEVLLRVDHASKVPIYECILLYSSTIFHNTNCVNLALPCKNQIRSKYFRNNCNANNMLSICHVEYKSVIVLYCMIFLRFQIPVCEPTQVQNLNDISLLLTTNSQNNTGWIRRIAVSAGQDLYYLQ